MGLRPADLLSAKADTKLQGRARPPKIFPGTCNFSPPRGVILKNPDRTV